MNTFITFVLILINCVVLFFVSFLAVGGDGSSRGVHLVQMVGYAWIFIASCLALFQCSRGNGKAGTTIAASTLPVLFVLGWVITMLGAVLKQFIELSEPTPPEVVQYCKSAGAQYSARPSAPVHSLAFDWSTSPQLSRFSYANKDPHKFGQFRFLDEIKYPPSVQFIERRFAFGLGVPAATAHPYVRKSNGGAFAGAERLTADALITYEITQPLEANKRDSFALVEITVADRRDGQVLATLRYAANGHNIPVCGETSPGEMNIAEFVFKAIGVVPAQSTTDR